MVCSNQHYKIKFVRGLPQMYDLPHVLRTSIKFKPQLNLKCKLIPCTFQVILSVNEVLIKFLCKPVLVFSPTNRLCGVMDSVLVSSQTEDYIIGILFFSAKHAVLKQQFI